MQYVRIESEQGGSAVLVNPWPGKAVSLYRNGASAGTLSGTELTISTTKGEVLSLATEGTSFADIESRISM